MLKGLGGLGGLADMASMMKAATEMQSKYAELQETLAQIVVVGESGAGLVKAHATAKGDITQLEIDPSILSGSDKEVIEDLILAAIQAAQARARRRTEKRTARLAEELGLPPGMKLPF